MIESREWEEGLGHIGRQQTFRGDKCVHKLGDGLSGVSIKTYLTILSTVYSTSVTPQ